jgi:hypothetical protein
MKGELTMSIKEQKRVDKLRAWERGDLTVKALSQEIDLSERQTYRVIARYTKQGIGGVVHRLRGARSNRAMASSFKKKVQRLYEAHYRDYGPTLLSEVLLSNHGLTVNDETLRGWFAGKWQSSRKSRKHRKKRERRSAIGEMIQFDGSDHDWFEGRAPRCVLVNYIDDATSRILYMEFVNVEDTLTLMRTTKTYLEKYGRPVALYVDRDSIYRTTRNASVEEQLEDKPSQTQFERAMIELNITVICAYSPQAKGRVERSFETHQDRLVKELRLRGISDQKTANQFLREEYILQHNERFAHPPANPTDAHRPLLHSHELNAILSIQEQRILAHDYTLQCRKQFFQLEKNQPLTLRPKDSITMEYRLDQSIHLRFENKYLSFHKISKRSPAQSYSTDLLKKIPQKPCQHPVDPLARWRQNQHQYPADHYSRY